MLGWGSSILMEMSILLKVIVDWSSHGVVQGIKLIVVLSTGLTWWAKYTECDLKVCSVSQNVPYLIWKNPRICPIWGQSNPHWAQIWWPRCWGLLLFDTWWCGEVEKTPAKTINRSVSMAIDTHRQIASHYTCQIGAIIIELGFAPNRKNLDWRWERAGREIER